MRLISEQSRQAVTVSLAEMLYPDADGPVLSPDRWPPAEIAPGEQPPNHACPESRAGRLDRRDAMRTTLLAAVAALSFATANATSGAASLGTSDPPAARALMAQASAQQAAGSSSGDTTQLTSVRGQPAGVGDRRGAAAPEPRQKLPRDYRSPAGIGCGLLCRAGIAAPPAQE